MTPANVLRLEPRHHREEPFLSIYAVEAWERMTIGGVRIYNPLDADARRRPVDPEGLRDRWVQFYYSDVWNGLSYRIHPAGWRDWFGYR